ncbi:MAG: patatin-like phospholipase family protein [Patescibacteria group bacterium]
MKTSIKSQKKVGLALGSGVFRGFAHIGVLKALKKHNIPIDYLSGSSIGAWAAAHYAIFCDVEKLEKDFAARPAGNLKPLLEVSLTGGFIAGRKLSEYLKSKLGRKSFSSLKIPLQITATDLISGQPFVFKRGDIATAVLASLSVPLVFKPVKYQDKLLVDGGLSDPVPGDLVRQAGVDIVIGVNLYNKNEFIAKKFTMSRAALRGTRIVMHNLAKNAVKSADIVVEPDCSEFIKTRDFKKYLNAATAERLIEVGERAMLKEMPELKRLLAA